MFYLRPRSYFFVTIYGSIFFSPPPPSFSWLRNVVRRNASSLRAPALIARYRRIGSAWGTWHAHLFCFCRPPGDSALGYWILFSGCCFPFCRCPHHPTIGNRPVLFPFNPFVDAWCPWGIPDAEMQSFVCVAGSISPCFAPLINVRDAVMRQPVTRNGIFSRNNLKRSSK